MFLKGKNLSLRALEPEDLDILYKWENDTELWKYGNSLSPYSKFTLKEYIENSGDIFQMRQVRLMVVDNSTEQTIGTADLYDYDPINERAGIGLLLDSNYRNKGLGVELLGLIEEYAFRFLFLKQLYAQIPIMNKASSKLFSKCGYKQTGLLENWLKMGDYYEDVLFMQKKAY
ncbi:GNAT family N-acetyltransferase [Bacteroidales bacterium OttesenSCG-928-M11]|nr:GNAT family N-acetyltransferase [Bacteroidales bacterium OttesenSCG-928-M11]